MLVGDLQGAMRCIQGEAKKAAAARAFGKASSPGNTHALEAGLLASGNLVAGKKESREHQVPHTKSDKKCAGGHPQPAAKKSRLGQLAPLAVSKKVPISVDGSHTVSAGADHFAK